MANLTKNLRDRCFIIMLYDSGCRISELIGDETHQGVRLKDIRQEQHGVTIDVTGKTGSRSLQLIPTAPAIANWMQNHPDRENPDAPLFCCLWGSKRGKEPVDYRYWFNLLTGKDDNRKRITDEMVSMSGLGEKAGIKKPTNPHWFRHSRLSELAKHLTESQLSYWAGWEQGTKQARTYVTMSGRDVNPAIRKMYGLEKEEEKHNEMSPMTCPRCQRINDPFAKYCSACSLLLDERSIMEFQRQKSIEKTLGNIAWETTDSEAKVKEFADQVMARVKKEIAEMMNTKKP